MSCKIQINQQPAPDNQQPEQLRSSDIIIENQNPPHPGAGTGWKIIHGKKQIPAQLVQKFI